MGGTTKLLTPHLLPNSFCHELTSPEWSYQGINLVEEIFGKDDVRAGSFSAHCVLSSRQIRAYQVPLEALSEFIHGAHESGPQVSGP